MNTANLRTEDEARKLWCPHVRVIFNGGESTWLVANKDFLDGIAKCGCIASECSQWLWADEHTDCPAGIEPKGGGWEKDGPSTGIGGAVTHRQRWKRLVGYCGLTQERS